MPITQIEPYYSTGVINVANGSTSVGGAGTAWLSNAEPGDLLLAGTGWGVVGSVNSNTGITLATAWAAPTVTGGSYFIYRVPDSVRLENFNQRMINLLVGGNLPALGALDGSGGDKGVYLTGSGAASTFALTAAARTLLDDTTTAAMLATLGATPSGTTVLKSGDTMTGVLTIDMASPRVNLDKTSGASTLAGSKDGVLRWLMDMGDGAAEAGGNSGSDFYLRAFDDAGNQLTIPLSIARNTGIVSVNATRMNVSSPGSAELSINKTGTASSVIASRKNGALRWQIDMGDGEAEAGGNSGSNWYLRSFSDGGSQIALVMSINRASGAVAFSGSLSKASGTFLIDHPLEPETRQLAHGFVEAPRYDLIYRGVATLIDGRATVDIDAASDMTAGTFAALTVNAVVTSLQNQSGFARLRPGAINGALFEIICEDDGSTDAVSWVVIAERNDTFVREKDDNCDDQGRFIPESDKPAGALNPA